MENKKFRVNKLFKNREFDYMKDNVIYFKRGDSCHYYNKFFTAKIYMECGYSDSFEFINKQEGCLLEFIYKSKIACNSIMLKNIMDRIKLLISEI